MIGLNRWPAIPKSLSLILLILFLTTENIVATENNVEELHSDGSVFVVKELVNGTQKSDAIDQVVRVVSEVNHLENRFDQHVVESSGTIANIIGITQIALGIAGLIVGSMIAYSILNVRDFRQQAERTLNDFERKKTDLDNYFDSEVALREREFWQFVDRLERRHRCLMYIASQDYKNPQLFADFRHLAELSREDAVVVASQIDKNGENFETDLVNLAKEVLRAPPNPSTKSE
ncbi:MAG: hypothetical protein WBD01_13350 [Salaquimonas sp.]